MATEDDLRHLLAETAAQREQIRALEHRLHTLEEAQGETDAELRQVQKTIAGARGAALPMLGIGGVLGWLITQWDHVVELFRGNGP